MYWNIHDMPAPTHLFASSTTVPLHVWLLPLCNGVSVTLAIQNLISFFFFECCSGFVGRCGSFAKQREAAAAAPPSPGGGGSEYVLSSLVLIICGAPRHVPNVLGGKVSQHTFRCHFSFGHKGRGTNADINTICRQLHFFHLWALEDDEWFSRWHLRASDIDNV